MDKSWIWSNNKSSEEYTNRVSTFINLSRSHLNDENKTPCPCTDCGNFYSHELETVERHLSVNSFSKSYTNWVYHGEDETASSFNIDDLESDINEDNEDSEEDDDEMFDVIEDITGGEHGTKKKAIDIPNNSTTTQPTESTQNEQEDLDSTTPTKKRTHGQNRSKGTSKLVADTKNKLPVTVKKGELHPVGVNASQLASEIGFILKNHAPLKYKGWKNVPPEDKALIHTRIKKRSVAAAKNKAKVPYNHRGGSKSFILEQKE
ncbi:hypothetical protein G4B88_011475 [Cannabis sativa]|uniref:Transposase-associated domain-containing protein n=1 Tax=Cannabis sativa TaxID=3483 RepID=A0A7J6H984_CANSA|nr:hypothetical protein G4B88_011475 [Cannabis sativa]